MSDNQSDKEQKPFPTKTTGVIQTEGADNTRQAPKPFPTKKTGKDLTEGTEE